MPNAYGQPSYESIYMGSFSPLDPEYGELFQGYRIPFSRIASETWGSPERAQVREVTARLSEGVRAVELKAMSPEILEMIPKDVGGMKEMQQLAKLTGAELILHGPIIDPAGFTREGWSESGKAESETRFKQLIDRAHELNPQGNAPVVMHATAGVPSTHWRVIEGKPEVQELYVVNRETGALDRVEREQRYFPYEHILEPGEALRMRNDTDWDRHTLPLIEYKKEADKLLERAWPIVAPRWQEITKEKTEIMEEFRQGKITAERANEMLGTVGEKIEPELQPFFNQVQMAQNYYNEISKHLGVLYDRAYKFAPDEQKEMIKKEITKKAEEFRAAARLQEINPAQASVVFHDLIESLRAMPPKTFVPAEDFCLEKGKETIANAALYAYKTYGDNAPALAMENFFAGTVFSQGEQLAQLVKTSRKEFVKKAREAGISESEARRAAEKLIGATWDIGHIHLLKKYGFGVKEGKYDEEEFKKMMAAETKAIAPFVKHVHITDNFGFEDSHLPPGMAEVPMKEILKELEKAGFKGKAVLEAGGWVSQFKTSPTPYALEALGSPLYSMFMPPFWNQVRGIYGVPAGYSMGYGLMLPEQHFSIYGSGFAALPAELGGQVPGRGQRFAGAPME